MNVVMMRAFRDELTKIAALSPVLLGSAVGALGGAGAGALAGGEGHRLSGALIGGAGGAALGAGAGAGIGHLMGKSKGVAAKAVQATAPAAIPAATPTMAAATPAVSHVPMAAAKPGSLMGDFNKAISQAQESINAVRNAPKTSIEREMARRALPKTEAAARRAKKLEDAYKMEYYNLPYSNTAPAAHAAAEARSNRLRELWNRASLTGAQ